MTAPANIMENNETLSKVLIGMLFSTLAAAKIPITPVIAIYKYIITSNAAI